MTAQRGSQTVRWAARAGLGLARSVILLAVSVLYPAVLALFAWLVWLAATNGGPWRTASGVELVLFGGVTCFVVPSGPICGLLRLLVRRWTGITMADGYRPAAPIA